MNIAIVGTGYVGLVSGACFAEMGIDVTCVDINPEKIKCLLNGEIPIYEPGLDDLVKRNVEAGRLHFTTDLTTCLDNVEVVFSAVGTPPDEDGSADLQYVLEVARTFGRNIKKYTILVTKSTVPVGTAKKVKAVIEEELTKRGEQIDFEVASNPEFLKEGAAIKDFMSPDRVVVGVESDRAKKGHGTALPSVPNEQLPALLHGHSLGRDDQIRSQCHAGHTHLLHERHRQSVRPGRSQRGHGAQRYRRRHPHRFEFLYPGCGYGGSCFPKDVKALAHTAREYGYTMGVIEAVEAVNERQKEIVVKKLQDKLGTLRGKTIALWGLAFKPETDDMREAPALVVIEKLLEAGASVKVYDPVAMDECRRRIGDRVVYCKDMYDVVIDADALAVLTEWKEFRIPSWSVIKRVMKQPVLVDGRNIYSKDEVIAEGFEYAAIGK